MKQSLLIIVCCLEVVSQTFANKIDQLQTDKEVAEFIVSLDSAHLSKQFGTQFTILSDETIALRIKKSRSRSANSGLRRR